MLAHRIGTNTMNLASEPFLLRKSLHTKTLRRDLILTSTLARTFDICFKGHRLFVSRQNTLPSISIVYICHLNNGVYEFDKYICASAVQITPQMHFQVPDKFSLLHRTFAHMHKEALNIIFRSYPHLSSLLSNIESSYT